MHHKNLNASFNRYGKSRRCLSTGPFLLPSPTPFLYLPVTGSSRGAAMGILLQSQELESLAGKLIFQVNRERLCPGERNAGTDDDDDEDGEEGGDKLLMGEKRVRPSWGEGFDSQRCVLVFDLLGGSGLCNSKSTMSVMRSAPVGRRQFYPIIILSHHHHHYFPLSKFFCIHIS